MTFRFLKFAITNAFRRKSTLLLATIGTGLGTALMATLISLSNGMNAQLNETINIVATDVTVSAEGGGLAGSLFGGGDPLKISNKEIIESIENVDLVQPQVSTSIPNEIYDTGSIAGSFVLGVDLEGDKLIDGPTQNIIEGQTITSNNEVIVGKAVIRQSSFRGNDIAIGDTIEYPIFEEITQQSESIESNQFQILTEPVDTLELEIVGIYETGNDFTDNRFVSTIETARKIAKLEDDEVTSFLVKANDSENVEQVAEDIESELKKNNTAVSVTISKDILGDLNDVLDIFDNFILVIALVAAISGGMSIFIIMLMSVMERLQEFGIFKATGWSNFNVVSSVIIESITVSFLGSFAGLSVSLVVGRIINGYLGEEIAVFNLELMLLIITFGLVMGILGGLYPAVRAARVSPIETLHSL